MATLKRPKTTSSLQGAQPSDRSSQVGGSESAPLTGLSLAAFWSVPVTAVVAAVCAAWLGYLTFVNPPKRNVVESSVSPELESIARPSRGSVQSTRESLASTTSPKIDRIEAGSKKDQPFFRHDMTSSRRNLTSKEQPAPEKVKPAEPTPSDSAPATRVPAVSTASMAPPAAEATTIALEAKMVYSLSIADGKIDLTGRGELAFDMQSPSIDTTKESSRSFSFLQFDGNEQAVELPPIQKPQGSIVVTVKVPEFKTSIFFDSSYQRLTLRKNAGGIRWRIEGARKQNKIRNVSEPFDAAKWHHIVMTWQADKEAILFVDGIELDRYPYQNEQPQFPNYEKVVVGKTRGPNGKHYECKIGELTVYDRPISADNVAALHNDLREKFPFIFNE